MDQHTETVLKKRIERTAKALEHNGMQPFYVERRDEVPALVKTLLHPGDTVSFGGSESLKQCNLFPLLRSGDYKLLDRGAPGITPQEIQEIYRKTFWADAYLCSTNAVTENGELYNVDGNGNRVAAITFGPKSVILVVGVNKIVRDLKEAEMRVKSMASPANCMRLSQQTYCQRCGECVSLATGNNQMTAGCDSPDRICCDYVILSNQRQKGRIKVIIVGEPTGY